MSVAVAVIGSNQAPPLPPQIVSQDDFDAEVRSIMEEYEIEELEEAAEETVAQYKERSERSVEGGRCGFDLSNVDTSWERLEPSTPVQTTEPSGVTVLNATAEPPVSSDCNNTVQMPAKLEQLAATLVDTKQLLGKRMRSLFYLRSVGGDTAIAAILGALRNKSNGSLLRHETAFVLGQMQARAALPTLIEILRDAADDAMTRHEAAEAIGAIGMADTMPILKEFTADASAEVADTCILALDRLGWQAAQRSAAQERGEAKDADDGDDMSLFNSVDPAPPLEGKTVDELQRILLDPSLSLFVRYGSLFALRDLNTDQAARIIADALDSDQSSALFRHEVAYVCGQLEKDVASAALRRALCRTDENVIVRHEAAEALGAISNAEDIALLKMRCKDPCRVVAESCHIALDVINYWATDPTPTTDTSDPSDGLLSKSQAAAAFAKPLQCSCTTRVVTMT